MTICIAAICENGKYVIVMSDRMITYMAPPFHQFEHPIPKIHKLGRNVVLMTAGSALLPSEFIYNIRYYSSRLNVNEADNSKEDSEQGISGSDDYIKVKSILKAVKEAYLSLRRQVIEERFLQKYDLRWEDYVNFVKGMKGSEGLLITPSMKIFAEIEEFKLELQAILAGVDDEGPHIYVIEDPGILNNFNDIGYAAIGSGNYHAMRSFIENNYSIDLPLWQALYIVYEAKKYAESAPGVGVQTDAMIVSRDGIKVLDPTSIGKLEEIYKEKQEHLAKNMEELYNKYKNILVEIVNS